MAVSTACWAERVRGDGRALWFAVSVGLHVGRMAQKRIAADLFQNSGTAVTPAIGLLMAAAVSAGAGVQRGDGAANLITEVEAWSQRSASNAT